MRVCLPQHCLPIVYVLRLPGDPLLRGGLGWWVKLQSVGHKHRTCSQTLYVTIYVP